MSKTFVGSRVRQLRSERGFQPGRAGADAGDLAELPQPDRARRSPADGGRAAADHRGVRGGRDLLRLPGRHPAGRRAARGDDGPRPGHRRRPARNRRNGQRPSRPGPRGGQPAPALPDHHRAAGRRHRGAVLRRQRHRVDHHAARRGARLLLPTAELPARAGHRRRGPHDPDAAAPRRPGPRVDPPAHRGARRAHQQADRPRRHRAAPLRPRDQDAGDQQPPLARASRCSRWPPNWPTSSSAI